MTAQSDSRRGPGEASARGARAAQRSRDTRGGQPPLLPPRQCRHRNRTTSGFL